MNIPVTTKTLKKALENNGDRIVLGGKDRTVFILLLAIWIASMLFMGTFLLTTFREFRPSSGGSLSFPAFFIAIWTAWCYLLGGWTSQLTLNLSSHTYLHEYGLYPFIQRRQGSLDAFDHISLAQEQRTSGGGGTYSIWLILLVKREDTEPPMGRSKRAPVDKPLTLWIRPGFTQDPVMVRELAYRLAQAVELPLLNYPNTPR